MTLTAVPRRPRPSRTGGSGRLAGSLTVLTAVSSLAGIAVGTIEGDSAGAALPVPGVGWLADVSFPVCDVGLLGLVVGLLPDVRPRGRHRAAVVALLILTGLTMLAEAFLPHIWTARGSPTRWRCRCPRRGRRWCSCWFR